MRHHGARALLAVGLILGLCTGMLFAGPGPKDAGTAREMKKSMKGWELYSWREPGRWMFALVAGTNRSKDFREISAVGGRTDLAGLLDGLGRLAGGEEISWLLEFPGRPEPAPLALPPAQVVESVSRACSDWHLKLTGPDRAAAPPILGIYLLENGNLTGEEALSQPLASLALQRRPILTQSDLVSYGWKDHSLTLKPAARQRLPRPGVFGIPFVVKAFGQPIYLGAFWTAASSASFANPIIDVTTGAARIERSCGGVPATATDPRAHPLMLDALRTAAIVRE